MPVTENQLQAARALFEQMGEPLPDAVTRVGDMTPGAYVGFVDGQAVPVWYTFNPGSSPALWTVRASGELDYTGHPHSETEIAAWRVVGNDRKGLPETALEPLERIRQLRLTPKVGDVVPAWMVPPRSIVHDVDEVFFGQGGYLMRFDQRGERVHRGENPEKTITAGIWPWTDRGTSRCRVVALDVDPKIDNAGVQRIVDVDRVAQAPPPPVPTRSRPKVGDVIAWNDVPPNTIVRTEDDWFTLRCTDRGECLGLTPESATRERRGDEGWRWNASTYNADQATIVALDVDPNADMDALRPELWAYLETRATPGAKIPWYDVPPGTLVRAGGAVYLRLGVDHCVDVESGKTSEWRVDVESGKTSEWHGLPTPTEDVGVLAVGVPESIPHPKLQQLATARSPGRPVAALYRALGEDVPEPVRLRDAPTGAYAVTRPSSERPIEFVCLVDQDRYAWTTGAGQSQTATEPAPAAWLWPVAGLRPALLLGDLNEHGAGMDEALTAVFAAHASSAPAPTTALRLRTLFCGDGVKVGDEIDWANVPVHAIVLYPTENLLCLRHVEGGEVVGKLGHRESVTRTAAVPCCDTRGKWIWESSRFKGSRVKVLALGVPCDVTTADLRRTLERTGTWTPPLPEYVRAAFCELGDPSPPTPNRLADAPPGLYLVDGGLVTVCADGRRTVMWGGRPVGEGSTRPIPDYGWIAACTVPPEFPSNMTATVSRVRYARDDDLQVAQRFVEAFDRWSGRWRGRCTPLVRADVCAYMMGGAPYRNNAYVLVWLPRVDLQTRPGGDVAAATWVVGHLDGLVRFDGWTPSPAAAIRAAIGHATAVLNRHAAVPRNATGAEPPDLRLWSGDGLGSRAWTSAGDQPSPQRIASDTVGAAAIDLSAAISLSGVAAVVPAGSGSYLAGGRVWQSGSRAYVVGYVEHAQDVSLWRLRVAAELSRRGISAVIPDFSPIVPELAHVGLDTTPCLR